MTSAAVLDGQRLTHRRAFRSDAGLHHDRARSCRLHNDGGLRGSSGGEGPRLTGRTVGIDVLPIGQRADNVDVTTIRERLVEDVIRVGGSSRVRVGEVEDQVLTVLYRFHSGHDRPGHGHLRSRRLGVRCTDGQPSYDDEEPSNDHHRFTHFAPTILFADWSRAGELNLNEQAVSGDRTSPQDVHSMMSLRGKLVSAPDSL